MICEIEESLREENDFDNRHIFTINGYVARIKNQDRVFYPACPNDECRKKVIEENGVYRCENCGKTYETCKPTYMISAKISDFTDSLYINFTREHGEALIGMPADAFKEKIESMTEEQTSDFFDQLMFRHFNILIKGRMETYMGEQRIRYFALKVLPAEGKPGVRHVQNENKSLLDRLKIYQDMPDRSQNNNQDQ